MAFQQRRNFVREPKSYPAAVTFCRDLYDFDLNLSDQAAWKAFFANVRNLDGAALKGLVAQGPVTVEGLRQSLTKGAEWREPTTFEPDGPKVNCVRCGTEFQPVLIPWKDENSGAEGVGGNYRTAKADEVKALSTGVQAYIETLTESVLKDAGNEGLPAGLTTRVIATCQNCRLLEFKRGTSRARFYRMREGIVDVLFERDAVISAVIAARERRDAYDHAFPSWHDRGGRDNERREFVSWNGVLVEPRTATILKAKVASGDLANSAEALAALSETELVAMGIVFHENAAAAVLRRAKATVSKAGVQQQASAPRHEAPMSASIGEVNFSRGERRGKDEGSNRRKGKKGQRR